MLPLIQRAQTLFRPSRDKVPPEPEPFELICEAGHSVRGHRWTNYQAAECPECGKQVFVLPLSPLPPPAAPVVRKLAPKRPRRRRRGLRLGVRAKYFGRRVLGRIESLRPPRRWFARERLIIAAILIVLGITGVVLLARSQRARALAVLQQQLGQGRASLERGEFAKAATELKEAEKAALRLGPGAADATEALQAACEANLLANLATSRLDEIAREARTAAESNELDEWASQVRVLYEGKSYLFDGVIVPRDSTDDTPYQFEFVLFEGDYRFEVDVSSLDLLHRLDLTEPQRLVFGARFVAVEPSIIDSRRWMFRLHPQSGVLLSRSEPLRQLGWTVDEDLVSVLQKQQVWAEGLAREDLQ